MKTLLHVSLFLALFLFTSGIARSQSPCPNYGYLYCGSVVSGSTVGVPNDNLNSDALSCSISSYGGQGWYQFSYPYLNTSPVTIYAVQGSTNYDTFISVYTGYCGSFECVAYNDDYNGLLSQVTFNADPYTYYYVRIGGFSYDQGSYTMAVECSTPGCTHPTACNYEPAAVADNGTCIDVPYNDYFYNMYQITFPSSAFGFDNRCTAYDYYDPTCGGNGDPIKDVWYYFYYTGGYVELNIVPGSFVGLTDSRMAIYDGCWGPEVACNDDYLGLNAGLMLSCADGLIPGCLYYVQIGGFGGDTGTAFLFVRQLDISGCTDPLYSNYDPCANVDDGSCQTSCTADLDNNGQVNISDLLLFTAQFGNTCN